MRRAVLDASVVAKWFAPTDADEPDLEPALQLHRDWDAGKLTLVAPELLLMELVSVAVRKWSMQAAALEMFGRMLIDLELTIRAVDPVRMVHWAGAGLSAYDAAYVVTAESEGLSLVTADAQIVRVAPDIAVPLGSLGS